MTQKVEDVINRIFRETFLPSNKKKEIIDVFLEPIEKRLSGKKPERPILEMQPDDIWEIFYTTKDGIRIKVFDLDIARQVENNGSIVITKRGKQEDDGDII